MCFLCYYAASTQHPSDFFKPLHQVVVHFDFGKHDLTPQARQQLDSLLALATPALSIRITAHTDSIGSAGANLRLSERRARSVADYLQQHGFPAEKLELHWKGERQPLTWNATESQRLLNRRATVEVGKWLPGVVIEGQILDAESGKGVEAEVVVHGQFFRDSTRSDTSGRFSATVPEGEVVGIDAYAPGYFFETTMLKALPNKMMPIKLMLPPAKPGEKFELKNFYFYANQAKLLPRSRPELPKLLRFLQMNPKVKIEIAGHVNLPNRPPMPKNSWEYNLSLERAKVVYEYLVEHGIDPDRLRYAGYSNWQMVYPKAYKEEQMAKNRRVEIHILEE